MNDVAFEQLLSFTPRLTPSRLLYEPRQQEPCLRDMIFDYYSRQFNDADKANEATKLYTNDLHLRFVSRRV